MGVNIRGGAYWKESTTSNYYSKFTTKESRVGVKNVCPLVLNVFVLLAWSVQSSATARNATSLRSYPPSLNFLLPFKKMPDRRLKRHLKEN